MDISSIFAAFRSEAVRLIRSIVRLLVFGILTFVGLVSWFIFLQPVLHNFSLQTTVSFALMALSLLPWIAKSQAPDRKTWIGVRAGIVATSIACVFLLPAWSAYIVGVAYLLFVVAPNVLASRARRRATAGYARAAAFYGRLFSVFHPSKQARFDASFLTARAVGPIDQKLAAYRALAAHATAEHSIRQNYQISIDQHDWEEVLGRLRSETSRLGSEWLEIRALGELGRIDEMITTYASSVPRASAETLPFCHLRSLLGSRLRFVRPRNKAYWIFVAGQAAGTPDDEARRDVASYLSADDDETFCRTARRHLDARPTPGGPALSTESHATIAAIEKTLGKQDGVHADFSQVFE